MINKTTRKLAFFRFPFADAGCPGFPHSAGMSTMNLSEGSEQWMTPGVRSFRPVAAGIRFVYSEALQLSSCRKQTTLECEVAKKKASFKNPKSNLVLCVAPYIPVFFSKTSATILGMQLHHISLSTSAFFVAKPP